MSHALKYWEAFYPEYPEGTPPIINVLSNSITETCLEIIIPGMWVEEVYEGGEIYHWLELPDYLTLMDVGFPALPAIGGYIGYYENSETYINYSDEDTLIFENYNVYPFQEPEPDYSFNNIGFNINYEFYSSNQWYPDERANVGDTEIMRDVPICHFGVVPFEYNAGEQQLKVHRRMTVEVGHIPSGGGFGKSHSADEDFVDMYDSLIVNYSVLDYYHDQLSIYDYLIVTHPDFEAQANDLANFLTNWLTYNVYVTTIDTANWQSVYNLIKKFYEGYRNDYVLIIGDTNYIPLPTKTIDSEDIPSDMVYACLTTDDNPDEVIPDVAVGRLSVRSTYYAQRQVNKIKDHYYYGMDPDRMLRVLLVSHKQWEKQDPVPDYYPYFKCKWRIHNHQYEKYWPTFSLMPGHLGYTNDDLIFYENLIHFGIINYRGHGSEIAWTEWNDDEEDFGPNEINCIYPGNERPVVFSITCLTGDITYEEGDCFCERWMNVTGGSVAIIGSTVTTATVANNPFDEWMYKVMYDEGERHLGMIENWAKLEMLKTLYNGNYYNSGLETHYAFLLLGDPSLEIVPPIISQPGEEDISKSGILEDLVKDKGIKEPEVMVYPNPTSSLFSIEINNTEGNIDIKLYDISGRLIHHDVESIINNRTVIHIRPEELGMTTGVYYIGISSEEINIVKRLLYIED